MTSETGRRLKWLAAAIVVAAIAAFAALKYAESWRPERTEYPTQGIMTGEHNGAVAMGRVKAAGADFAYLDASDGGARHDAHYLGNRQRAREAGMRYGAVHHFDLCAMASEQAANFARYVPRDADMLPPLLTLDFDGCDRRPTRALVLSELTTFLAQAEQHAAKPFILMPDEEFEQAYQVTGAFERAIGIVGNFRIPAYASRSWALWLANDFARAEGIQGAVRWMVVYPRS